MTSSKSAGTTRSRLSLKATPKGHRRDSGGPGLFPRESGSPPFCPGPAGWLAGAAGREFPPFFGRTFSQYKESFTETAVSRGTSLFRSERREPIGKDQAV